MSDAKGKKKKVIAIILILAIAAGVLAFLFLNSLVSEGKTGLEVETSKLTQKGNKFLLSITIKNIGLEPLTKVNVTVNGDEQFFCDFSDDPLQANETRVIVLKLEKTYEVGNSYTIDVQVPLVGECLQTITFSITAEHEPEVEKVNVKFQVEGLDATATGTVLVVDSVAYSAPPETFEWEVGSSHTFEWCENISSTSPSKLFMWETTTGLSNKRFDTLTASENGTVKATYRLTEETTIGKVVFTVEGLNADTTGVLLIVDGVNYSSLPQTFLWANGTEHSFQYSQTVSSTTTDKQYSLLEVNGPQSPLTVTTTLLVITGYYAAEYKVTFMQQGLTCTATGTIVNITYLNERFSLTYDNLPFSLWVRDKLFFSFSETVEGFLNEARFRLVGVNASSPFEPSSYTVIIATYHLQYRLIINTSPIEGGTTDPPVGTHWFDYCTSVNVTAFSAPDYTFEFWILNGANVGSDNPIRIPIDQNHNLTAVFIEKGKVTFMAEGLGPDANSPVLTVDGVYYLYPDLPIVFTWDTDSPHDFAWHSPISTGELKQYVWVKTSGLSDLQTGTVIALASGGIVLAKYNTTFSVIFDATGLDDSATGTVLTVDGASYSKTDLPLVFNWEESSVHTYAFADTVDSIIGGKHFILVEVTGLVSPLTVEGSTTIIGHYKVQWQITFDQTGLDSSATGTVVTVNGVNKAYPDLPFSKWVDDGTVVAYTYANPVSGSSSEKQFELISVTGQASPVVVSANTVVIGNYQLQWQITFDQTGLDSSATGVVVTVDGVSKAYSDLPFSKWVNDGTTVVYSYSNPVSSSTSGKHFDLSNVTGLPSPVIVSSSVTVTGNYVTQLELVFTQTGLDSSATGTVVTVNGAVKTYAELPYSTWVNVGSVVTYSFSNPVSSTTIQKRFNLTSVTGLVSPVVVNSKTTVIGNYITQWQVVFSQIGLDSSATGVVVTVNGNVKTCFELPYAVWVNEGDVVTYLFSDVISSTTTNKRFNLLSLTGSSSPLTVTTSETITGNYKTQWLIIFDQVGLDSTATGTVVTVNGVTKNCSELPYFAWFDEESTVTYTYTSFIDGFTLAGVIGPSSPITVTNSANVIGNYCSPSPHYQVTFTQTGLDSTVAGTVVVVNGSDIPYSDLPYTITVNSGDTLLYSYVSPKSSSTPDKRFVLSGISGPTSPVVVTGSFTVTGNYVVQWQVTFTHSGLDATATGTVVVVDGFSKSYADFPFSKWVNNGAIVTYGFTSPVSSSTTGKRFNLTSVTGSTSPITVTSATTVTGNYVVQWQVTFAQTGLDSSATGTVVTVNGTPISYGSLPYSKWVNNGASVTYAYTGPVSSSTAGKRFQLASTSGPSSPITVTSTVTVTGNYVIQWQITFTQTGLDSSATGTVVTIDGVTKTYSDLSFSKWVNNGASVTYSYSSPVSSSTTGKRFSQSSVSGPSSPITVTSATTVTGNYFVQWQITFSQTGLDSTATGTVVTVDGSSFGYGSLPYSKWVDSGSLVVYSYASPVSSSTPSTQFTLTGVSGPSSPVTVASAVTVIGNYTVHTLQLSVTFTHTGLDSSATGTVVTVNGVSVQFSSLPYTILVASGSSVTYSYSSPISSSTAGKRFGLTSVTGPASPMPISSAVTVTGNYNVQWLITFQCCSVLDSSATGTVVVINSAVKTYADLPFSGWYNDGATITYSYSTIVSSSTLSKRFRFTMFFGPVSPITVTGATTVTGQYEVQWQVTFTHSGLDSSATGTVVTVDGSVKAYADLPFSKWVDNWASVTYSYSSPVSSSTVGKRFSLSSVSGPTSPIVVTSAVTVTGNYVVQWRVTFAQTGLDSSATGTVVTVDASTKAYGNLPFSKWVDEGATVVYVYSDPVSSTIAGKRFHLSSVTGSASPIIVSSALTITGNYVVQWQIIFTQTGLDSTATGTVVSVNTQNKGYSDLPYSLWVESGATVSYTFFDSVSSSTSGKRFRLSSVTGAASPIIVTSCTTVTGNYFTQWLVTFDQTGLDSSATGTVVAVNTTTVGYSSLPYSVWVNNGLVITYSYSNPVASSTPGKQFNLTGVTGAASPITVTSAQTIIGNYVVYCTCLTVTFTHTGLDSSATGTIVTVNGVNVAYSSLPYSLTVSYGSTVTYTYYTPISSSTTGKRFRLISVTGLGSPITVTSSITIIGNYIKQYLVTFSHTGLGPCANGTVVTINGTAKGYSALPYSDWYDEGTTLSYTYHSPVSTVILGKRFLLVSVTGPSSPITVTSPLTIIGNYIPQYLITLAQTGLDSSATGTVVTVNGTSKGYADLPFSDWFNNGATVIYAYSSPVSSSTPSIQFVLTGVTGLTSPITVSSSATIIGNYYAQCICFQVVFTQTGLDSSATGTVLVVNSVNLQYSNLPYTITVSSGGVVTYTYTSTVSSSTSGKRFRLVSVAGPSSPITVTSSVTVTGNYVVQWLITWTQTGLDSSAIGTVVTVNGGAKTYAQLPFSDWFDNGAAVTYQYSNPVTSSTPGKSFTLTSVSGPTSPITVTNTATIIGNYCSCITQFTVTFTHTGLDSSATGTVVTVNGTNIPYSSLPYSILVNLGDTVTYSYLSPVSSSTSGKRFRLVSVSGASSPVTVTSSTTITGNYIAQCLVTFTHSGLDSSSTGTILTVNGTTRLFGDLPLSNWYDSGTVLTYSYSSPVPSSTTGKRFRLSSVSGPASPITVTTTATITGNYVVQWQVTFTQTGLDSSATGTVVTINSVSKTFGDLAFIDWYDNGATITYSYSNPVSSSVVGKRFSLIGVTGSTSPITVTSAATVTGNYIVQWQVTFTHTGLDSSATGTVVMVDGVTMSYGSLPYSKWVNNGASVTYAYTNPVSSSTTGKRFRLSSVSGPASPITVTSSQTVTGNYVVQWKVTFTHSGLDSSATGTVVTVNGTGKAYADLPFTEWYDEGDSITYSYADPVSSSTDGKRFDWTSNTGPLSPITVSSKTTVTGNYVVQWQITFTHTGLDASATGTVVMVNAVDVPFGSLPYSNWYTAGSLVTSVYFDPVSSSTTGKRFSLSSVTGPTSPITVTSATTVTGNYVVQYQLTMQVSPTGYGTTTPAVGSYWYNSTSSVSISASANSGYAFSSWTGSGSGSYTGTSSSATITMNGPITETANFVVTFVPPTITTKEYVDDPVSMSYTVSVSNSFVVIVISTGNYRINTVTPPAGFTQLELKNGPDGYESVYIAVCSAQAAGTYTVSATGPSGGYTEFSLAAYVFVPGTYSYSSKSVSSSSSPLSLTMDSGYDYYIFGGGSGYQTMTLHTTTVDVSGILSAVGHQSTVTASITTYPVSIPRVLGGFEIKRTG